MFLELCKRCILNVPKFATTGVCAQTLHFTDKDTILSHMDMFRGLKILKAFVLISFFRYNKRLKSSLTPLNMCIKLV